VWPSGRGIGILVVGIFQAGQRIVVARAIDTAQDGCPHFEARETTTSQFTR
jgi:hypothetical protein